MLLVAATPVSAGAVPTQDEDEVALVLQVAAAARAGTIPRMLAVATITGRLVAVLRPKDVARLSLSEPSTSAVRLVSVYH
jgi:hypothetical protein